MEEGWRKRREVRKLRKMVLPAGCKMLMKEGWRKKEDRSVDVGNRALSNSQWDSACDLIIGRMFPNVKFTHGFQRRVGGRKVSRLRNMILSNSQKKGL